MATEIESLLEYTLNVGANVNDIKGKVSVNIN